MNQNEIKNHQTLCFPFEFVSMNNQKCSFLQNVEAILDADLQAGDSFGCKIKGCHTHAGSKIHFQDFVEAEILFHNNYYNHGFAYLTVSEILSQIKKDGALYKHIYLIGYESYSELYLQEVKRQLEVTARDCSGNLVTCDYFIYETIASNKNTRKKTTPSIRNLYKDKRTGECDCCYGLPDKKYKVMHPFTLTLLESLFVFIVPINTTLSTMDKMISLFKRESDLNNSSIAPCQFKSMYLCLITIGPEHDKLSENIYWDMYDEPSGNRGDWLSPKEGKFLNLHSFDLVRSFAFSESTWTYAKKLQDVEGICETCYPDKAIGPSATIEEKAAALLTETPIFDVTRGSVVPMLQLGQLPQLEPVPDVIDTTKAPVDPMVNLMRVWALSEYTSHHHISRGNNHFQYYIDTPGFINAYGYSPADNEDKLSIVRYLCTIRESSDPLPEGKVVYNYIVAPSHNTNAAWLNLVCSIIFTNDEAEFNEEFNGARVLYFDIEKEYRSNFKAKYSDFFQSFSNIIRRNEDYEVRFHYVDETISSGSRFLRAADLVQSLITSILREEKESEKEKILNRVSLFHSVYLLYGRSSYDSKLFYYRLFKEACLNNIETLMQKNFHEYVSVRISQMRNYKDACVLCKMTDDYRLIQKYCATNTLADYCGEIIDRHKPMKALQLAYDGNFYCDLEKRYLLLISHILNSRICTGNTPLFKGKEKEGENNWRQINVEAENASSEIGQILRDYYQNLENWLKEIPHFNVDYDPTYFYQAFIKAISRPFFTFHLRKRQAAFAFCLELLDKELEKSTKNISLIQTLVNALADMNANYLIRQTTFNHLINLTERFDVFAKKYCAAIKKMLALSQDTTKSLLLEHILVNQSESGFFREVDPAKVGKGISSFIKDRRTMSIQGVLYVENNRIINDALSDIHSNPKLTEKAQSAYFLDNFYSLLHINCSSVEESFGGTYKGLVDDIENNKVLTFSKLRKMMLGIIPQKDPKDSKASINVATDQFWVMPFVRIKSISDDSQNFNKLFEFVHFTVEETPEDRKKFYHDSNFAVLRKMFRETFDASDKQVVSISKPISKDVVFSSDGVVCVRFLPFKQVPFGKKTSTDCPQEKLGEKPGSLPNAEQEKTDDALYLEIQHFDKNNIVHWLRLKTLLSLHAAIADMIAAINMPVAIERKHNEMLQAAISEKSSLMHSDIEAAMNMKFWPRKPEVFGINKAIESIQEPRNETTPDGAGELAGVISRLFCQYYSRLADELLASWYRKLVRREKSYSNSQLEQKDLLPVWRNICQQPFFKIADSNDTVEDFFTSIFSARFYGNYTQHIERIKELEATWSNTTEQQEEYHTILEKLVELVPELAGIINLKTDEINGGVDAILIQTKALQEKEKLLFCVGEFTYYIHQVEDRFLDVKVKLWVRSSKNANQANENFEVLSLATDGSRISRSTFYPIIALLIQNAAVHGNASEVNILFDIPQKCIRIENSVSQQIDDTYTKRLDDFMSILPFIRNNGGQDIGEKNGGITLWTLKHLIKKRDWINTVVDIKKQQFRVTLSNCIEPYYETESGVEL